MAFIETHGGHGRPHPPKYAKTDKDVRIVMEARRLAWKSGDLSNVDMELSTGTVTLMFSKANMLGYMETKEVSSGKETVSFLRKILSL